jgi:lipopolysaccharide biosynthesis protein
MKIIILYVYSKTDKYGDLALNFFLQNGLKETKECDYYFIINGEIELNTLKKVPSYFNIVTRPNIGYDFGAWSDVILNLDITKYDYFLFLNNSVVGPCLPRYLKNIFWPELFYKHIDGKIKLVGCTTNYDITQHIQSYCFCVDIIGLNILIKSGIFIKNLDKNKNDIIYEHEIKMLQYIQKAGYNGYTFETVRNLDKTKMIKNGNLTDGIYFKINYNHELSPYEVVFIKPRLNYYNNAFLFYLKSIGIDINFKNEITNENVLENINRNKIIKNQVILIKNIIENK